LRSCKYSGARYWAFIIGMCRYIKWITLAKLMFIQSMKKDCNLGTKTINYWLTDSGIRSNACLIGSTS
jgi:hypothetical protein